jgi:outer membrane protein OmpA-like peptidoglycan-associated protein
MSALRRIAGIFMLLFFLKTSPAQNLIGNSTFDACFTFYDLNHNLVYQPVGWFYPDSQFNHPVYFSTDRYLNKTISYNIHPDSAVINRGGIANYISATVFPSVQKTYTELAAPLKPHTLYRISLEVRAADQSNYASDLLLGLKTTLAPKIDSCQYQVRLEIPDSLCNEGLFENWILLSDTFRAAGGEKFLMLNSGSSGQYAGLIAANREKYEIIRYQGPPKLKYYIDNVALQEVIPPSVSTTLFDTLKSGEAIILQHIYFDFDKADIRASSFPELELVLQYLETHPNVDIQISGHTDNFGSDTYNGRLSTARAQAVVTWLVARGISAKRLKALGFGSQKPLEPNTTSAGRQRNRRIEMQVLP